ncbi:MAG: isoleucine--tRNA ligase [Phycisphaerae bacterium]|nr:isoleucine--tRNA ligase [Phycisphaerae bacterium]
MFKDVPAQFDFPKTELQVLAFWERHAIYERSLAQRRGGRPFVFYEGPPTANGLPHPGHCLTRAIKDLFPRYRTMCGEYCERKAGWDTHGLPVEVEVCKELGIHSKEEIEKFGVEPFIHKCMESVFRYTKEWEGLTRRLGFWVNLDEAYVTYHQSYVESVWWALRTLFDAGLLYQGHKIVWWWAQGGTALSSGEVGQGYRTVDDPSVYVRFPLVGDERYKALFGESEPGAQATGSPRISLLVWTTTPWTLISNTFAAVHRDFEYAVCRDEKSGERLIVAADLVGALSKKFKCEWVVERRLKGGELIGLRYVPPYEAYYASLGPRRAALRAGGEEYVAWRVLAADFVTLDSGTGLVHEAPAFGEVDFDLLQSERERFADRETVPLLCAVAPDGTFTDEAPEKYRGRWVKEADKDILRDLKERGLLLHQETYRHEYPFCWRAEEDPLIQYPRRSWFIRTTQFQRDMLDNNQAIRWLPREGIQGDVDGRGGRFGDFLANNVDWSLSRERYWGTPLPIWVCEKTGHMEAVGSWDELMAKPDVQGIDVWESAKRKHAGLSEHLKVHKPYIDAITYRSPKDATARMRRVRDVIDCWFDSGAMPFAQWGYPHASSSVARFDTNFPCDFISEALDQTRGWFYSLLAIATMLFGRHGVASRAAAGARPSEGVWPQPFRNCIVLGLLLGEDGLKMSKSKKNYKEPSYIFDHEGADAMRWMFFSGQAPWTSIRFQEATIAEGQREFLIRLHNVYSFFTIYANIDGWTPDASRGGGIAWAELDRWIRSELHRTIRAVRQAMDAFDNYPAARALIDFVDSLSNWYVRRSRDRFWAEGMSADKRAAYATLYECLVTTAKLIAPFVPFYAEAMYQNLVHRRTVADAMAQVVDATDAPAAPRSIHLCDYPAPDERLIDETLSAEMAVVREIVSLGRAARAEAKLRVRQPLARVEIVLADRSHAAWLTAHESVIADELNVKKVEFIGEADRYVEYRIAPNFKSIGPKFGKLGPRIKEALSAVADPGAARRALDATGRLPLIVDGQTIELTGEDVQIGLTARSGWAAAQGRSAVVVLSTELTEPLRDEGLARELVHHAQQLRKALQLRYEQRIELGIRGDGTIARVVKEFGPYISRETLAASVKEDVPGAPKTESVEVEGHACTIALRPV